MKSKKGNHYSLQCEAKLRRALNEIGLKANVRRHWKPIFGGYLAVKACDIFSLFRQLVLGFGYCLIVSWLFYLLGFMLSVSLTGFYNENEPN